MRAEIIAIGDELTTGQRLDTNSQWLSQRLVEMGIDVAFHTTVADDLEVSAAAFSTAIDRADVVIATGGIGPTADDLTREAVALATGTELVEDPAALEQIRQRFARLSRTMPERNKLQAQFPQGSRPVPNPQGTAPGIDMTVTRPCCQPCRLFALPGVPAEMFTMWQETVAPAIGLTHRSGRVTRHRRIKCFGTGESHLEAMLPDLVRRGREPLVGITVSGATITLRITASGATERECFKSMESTVAQIQDALGVLVFGEEDDELQHSVLRLLSEQNKSIAVAEWGTEGRVIGWLAEAAGAGEGFLAGTMIRNASGLSSLLDVAVPADADGTSAETATAMAVAIRRRTGADFGLAIAAMPQVSDDSTESGKPPLLHIVLAMEDNQRSKSFPIAGHPAFVKTRLAKHALNELRLALVR